MREPNKFEGRVMGYKIDLGPGIQMTSESLDHIGKIHLHTRWEGVSLEAWEERMSYI